MLSSYMLQSKILHKVMQSSGAISQVSLILIVDCKESVLMVASFQARAAASASSLFLSSSGDRNSSFFFGS